METKEGTGDIMNGIFICTDRQLHDAWHACVRVGADKTADRIAKEMARRALRAMAGGPSFDPQGIQPVAA